MRHYENVLPAAEDEFDQEVSNFMDVARTARSHRTKKEVQELARATARSTKLEMVFREFDLDSRGTIEAAELLVLGGDRPGGWSPERNMRAVARMDTDEHGCISMQEFVQHYEQVLPASQGEFDIELDHFMEAARAAVEALRQEKEAAEQEAAEKLEALAADHAQLEARRRRREEEASRRVRRRWRPHHVALTFEASRIRQGVALVKVVPEHSGPCRCSAFFMGRQRGCHQDWSRSVPADVDCFSSFYYRSGLCCAVGVVPWYSHAPPTI